MVEEEHAEGSFGERPLEPPPKPTREEPNPDYLPKPYNPYPTKPLPIRQPAPLVPTPQPSQEKPRTLPEFDEMANKELKHYGRRIVKGSTYELMKWCVIIFGLIGLVFGYAILNDSFKTTIDCPTFPKIPDPVIIPPCPSAPNFSCGDLACGNCNFPNSININLTNGTG